MGPWYRENRAEKALASPRRAASSSPTSSTSLWGCRADGEKFLNLDEPQVSVSTRASPPVCMAGDGENRSTFIASPAGCTLQTQSRLSERGLRRVRLAGES